MVNIGLLPIVVTALFMAYPKHSQAIALKEVRGYHIGGRKVSLHKLPVTEVASIPGAPPRKSDPNGDYQVGQLYVQQFILKSPKAKYPLLMWHGGGLTGVIWETTPDGRPGWHQFFMEQGYDTWISDAPERGRASWARYPEINVTEPEHRTLNLAWEQFRLGPKGSYLSRKAYSGLQFPITKIEQFQKQFVARWTSREADAWTQKAYNDLVEQAGPCIIVAHSQGNIYAFNAALAYPDKVKAVISLAPAIGPNFLKQDLPSSFKKVAHLVIWGDYLEYSPMWQQYRQFSEQYLNQISSQGADVTTIDLPQQGIKGNSHLLMMDKNSNEIARIVQKWIENKGLFSN